MTVVEHKPKQKILYGAGEMGRRAFEYYTKDDPDAVHCFADTYKGGSVWCGKSVISFDEFVRVFREYDVVICVFDISSLLQPFEADEVNVFTVWEDELTIPLPERKREHFDYLRTLDRSYRDARLKILYGAGYYGEIAFHYYGADRVYAFADREKSGGALLGKNILSPGELYALCGDYEIVVCVRQYGGVLEDFERRGITGYALYVQLDDVRAKRPELDSSYKGSIADPEILRELQGLDFIARPEYLDEYHDAFVRAARRIDSIAPDKERIPTRNLGENKSYGYMSAILRFAERDMEYYEAPAILHGIPILPTPVALQWHNLMEAGPLVLEYTYQASKDCLCFLVGPYLQYAESFYDLEKVEKLKRARGKTLTVFPVHSSYLFGYSYDSRSFVNRVMDEAKKFDSLTVCVFFSDLHRETTELLRANGANIVTSGFPGDSSFATRLKTILLLSDACLTNSLGTNIVFALNMNIPVKFIDSRMEVYSTMDSKERLDSYLTHKTGSILALEKALKMEDYRITQEQLDLFEPIAGLSISRTKEELGAIFDLSKRIVVNCEYKASRYVDSLRSVYRELQHAVTPEEKFQFRLMKEALPADYDEYLKTVL